MFILGHRALLLLVNNISILIMMHIVHNIAKIPTTTRAPLSLSPTQHYTRSKPVQSLRLEMSNKIRVGVGVINHAEHESDVRNEWKPTWIAELKFE